MLFLAASFVQTSCNCSNYNGNDYSYKSSDKEFSFIQEYKVVSPANLKISTSGGNVTAEGRESDVIEVAFIVRKKNQVLDITLEDLKKIAEVEIFADNNSLSIKIDNINDRSLSVGFMIKTPKKSICKLNTSGGNISVSDLSGEQDINTSGGNVRINSINGGVSASTSGGNVSAEGCSGKLHLSTSGGNINVSNTKPELYARTSGGNIRLTKVEGPVDVSTSGGSITLNEIQGSVKAKTSGGNINADIEQLSDRLELRTSGGSINATIPSGLGMDLDISGEKVNVPLSNFTGTSKKDIIRGQMNGGGISVQMSTSGGSVTIDYK